MVEAQDEADDTAFGDARDVMDVVHAKAHDGGPEQDDEHSLGEFTWLKPAMRTLGLSPSVVASSLLIVVTFWCCVFLRGMDITSPK